MPDVSINYLAVLVAALANMFIGYVWYHMKVFGTIWSTLVGMEAMTANMTPEQRKKSGMWAMVGMFIVALIANYVLAHFVDYTQAKTFVDGMVTGFWLWLGFSGAVLCTMVFFERRPVKWFAITAGYQLVALVITGGLLAIWA